ncbi:MAG: DUF2905 domain-containing protein [Acidiferrobacterales bacterium]
MPSVSRLFIVIGIALIIIGLAWPWLHRFGLGRLPGDIVIERGTFRIFLPITTSILISLVLTVIFWLLRK